MILGEIIWNTEILNGVWNTANAIKKIAMLIMPLFMLIESGTAIIKYFSGKEGATFVDFNKFFTYILLWICLAFYTPIMKLFNSTIDSLVTYTDSIKISDIVTGAEDKSIELILFESKYVAIPGGIKKTMETIQKEQAANPGDVAVVSPITSFVDGIKNAFSSPLTFLSELISDGVTYIIRMVVERISYLLVSVLIIIGPLAVAFNAAPFFGPGTLVKWFVAWLGIKCWMLTMSALDLMIEIISLSNVLNTKDMSLLSGIEQSYLTLSVNVSIIIAYMMTPWITNKYINSDGGTMMSIATQGGSTLMKAGKALSTKGASILK